MQNMNTGSSQVHASINSVKGRIYKLISEDIKNNLGHTPLDLATEGGHQKICE